MQTAKMVTICSETQARVQTWTLVKLYSNTCNIIFFSCYESKQTMPACSTSGVYTIHTNGANHTRRTSQFLRACVASPGAKKTQPRARTEYSVNLASRPRVDDAGDESDSGIPMATARLAASEKLSTDVIEMTVEAKQRLKLLRIM